MSFWRSNTVNCYQLILPRENAHRIVEQLGTSPLIQAGSATSNSNITSTLPRSPSSPRSNSWKTHFRSLPSCRTY
jgi:hypothetical protein